MSYSENRKLKLIVTGGAGFIGSCVVRQALDAGYEVLNIDMLTYAATLESVTEISEHPRYHFCQVDIRDKHKVQSVYNKFQPDAVLHLAAESHVDRSIDNPSIFVETNVVGTLNLLEVSRAYWMNSGCPENFKFLHVSTDEVFGSLSSDPKDLFIETTPYAPRSPYSASKASSDHLARAWHATFGLPVLITNCSNNYGPRQFPEKLIPTLIINALSGNQLPIYGTGSNVRDWLFVEDHADALLTVLKDGKPGESYNIGCRNEYTNIEIAMMVCKILDRLQPLDHGSYDELITFVRDRPGHDARYAIDPAKIKDELGWCAVTKFEDGLENTVHWYLNNREWWLPLLRRDGVGDRLGNIK